MIQYPNCSPPYITIDEAQPLESQDHFIFLWMPKVAGMSISLTLKTRYEETYLALENRLKRFNPQLKGVTFYHIHVPALVEGGYISSDWVENAFKFAFVRNPWDRMVSLYHWLKKCPKEDIGFENFILNVEKGNYEHPGRTNLRGLYQANRLVDWLRPNEIWLPQFIGRFENLLEDWKIIQKILNCKLDLRHNNKSQHTHYSDYYTKQTKTQVAKRFEEDIDLFKYTFEE